ncbi:MAG: tRNA (adenosine(37)-N6)-threonylcarbamoyltransferase complex transferase subunit TsaD [Phycisphaerae bacterium]
MLGIDHIQAHATSAAIENESFRWPAVALVVSGGHTSLYHVRSFHDIELLGRTIDDAAGEAFDKVATILHMDYPGGPIVDERARRGDPESIQFPRSMLGPGSLDFSFSGMKTAVLYHVHGPGKTTGGLERLTAQEIDDICAAFSAAVVDVLVAKTLLAVEQQRASTIVVGGGVAANSLLRNRLTDACRTRGLSLHLTPVCYCSDNAAMIAALGCHLFDRGYRDDWTLSARSRIDLP